MDFYLCLYVKLYSLTQSMENEAEHIFHGCILNYDSFKDLFLTVFIV